jgi:IS30 family transposase
MIPLLQSVREVARTLSLDNCSEFAEHEHMAKALHLNTYFCDLHCSGQRGTNKNTNGLLRPYYPKWMNFGRLSQIHINRVVEQLNNRPKKRLGYRTPPAKMFWCEFGRAL